MLKAVLSTLTWLAVLLASLILVAWAVGHAVTDRWEWSQYLYWMPTPGALALSLLALMVSTGCAVLARLVALPRMRRGPAFWARAAVIVLWVCVAVDMVGVEWRLLKGAPPGPLTSSFRVLFWNSEVERMDRFEERVLGQKPDIAVVANAPHRGDWQQIRDGLGGTMFSARSARFTVVSRFPVVRWGTTDLRITGSRPRVAVWPGGGNIGVDSGEAIFVELDTTPVTGRTTVVWGLDLPSDPGMVRMRMMQQAMATIEGFTGPSYRRNAAGMDERGVVAGFPTPDLIVGDFNTPRGSESLRVIAGEMKHAFDQAGHGFAATWPRKMPVIAIDQAFVGPGLRAAGYEIVDLGAAQHGAQVIDLVGVKGP